MKIDVSFISIKHYDIKNIMQWMWYFKTYKYVSGFIMRIFGIYINVRENNATEKLITLTRQRMKANA